MFSGGEGFFIRNRTTERFDSEVLQGALIWPDGVQSAAVDSKIRRDSSFVLVLSYEKTDGTLFRYCKVAAPSFDKAFDQLRACQNEQKKLPDFPFRNRGVIRVGSIDQMDLGLLLTPFNPREASLHTNSGEDFTEVTLSYTTQTGQVKNYATVRAAGHVKYEVLIEALKTAKAGETVTYQPKPEDIQKPVEW